MILRIMLYYSIWTRKDSLNQKQFVILLIWVCYTMLYLLYQKNSQGFFERPVRNSILGRRSLYMVQV